ncbi:MAG: peroxide stress protein YaaA [Nitrospirae bacterium]|nr:MAG: peroxide stress protein YaaA [Nitrospirota bacterium]
MIALLSPAKSLNLAPPRQPLETTLPALLADTELLVERCRALSEAELAALMRISPKLARLNRDRFHAFHLPFRPDNATPAALAFDGAVYRGLDARSLEAETLAWGQDRIAILSGLYGLLRPLDLIQPYRLEMGTRLENPRGRDLYAFWGDRIARRIAETAAGHADPTVVNLASAEYFKAVRQEALGLPVVTCVFEEYREGPEDGRVIAVHAKRARGLMARFLLEGRLERAEQLQGFTAEGYRFRPERSREDRWVFSRPQPPRKG